MSLPSHQVQDTDRKHLKDHYVNVSFFVSISAYVQSVHVHLNVCTDAFVCISSKCYPVSCPSVAG